MSTWAIVALKKLSKAKSSLSKMLNSQQRRRLVLAMLSDMLKALNHAKSISVTAVVSPDKQVLDFARSGGAVGIAEPGFDLNGALRFAIKYATDQGATSVLLLSGDLPLLKASDVENIAVMATAQRDVVIAPSKTNGTNALFLRPPDVIPLRFGGESFPLHAREAMNAGIKPRIYRSPTVATDIDAPEDLLVVEASGLNTETYEFVLSLKK